MSHLYILIAEFRSDRRGATAIEYGLIAALIVVAAIGGMKAFGSGLIEMWDHVNTEVTTASTN